MSGSERLEHAAIVFSLDCLGSHLRGFERAATGTSLVIQNGGVEFFFSCEVAEDHGLGNTGGVGDLFGGCALETPVGKETYGHFDDL